MRISLPCVFARVACLALPLLLTNAVFSQTATAPAKIKITPGKETTWFTDPPLHADGTVDYVKANDAMLQQGVTPDNNAFAAIVKTLGPSVISDAARDDTLTELGLKDLPDAGNYYQTFIDYVSQLGIAANAQDGIMDQPMEVNGHAWSADGHPELAAWLKREEKHIDALAAAMGRDRFVLPAISKDDMMISVLLPSLGEFRDVAQALAVRASLRAGEGNLEGAMKDSLAVHRMGLLMTQPGTVIQYLVGYSVERLAVTADRAILSSPKLTAVQARAFLADLQKLPPLGSTADCIDNSERLDMLDTVMVVARGPSPILMSLVAANADDGSAALVTLTPQQAAALDWDALLRRMNARYDAMVAAARQPTYMQRAEAWKKVEADLDAMTAMAKTMAIAPQMVSPAKRVEAFLTSNMIPSMEKAGVLHDRVAMLLEEDKIACALAAYHAEKGAYPDALFALRPDYLKAIPDDCFTGDALVYRATDSGFVLYSLNDDLEDNGGSDTRDAKGHSDLVIRVEK